MHISEAVAVEADQSPARHAADRQVDDDVFIGPVIVMRVVRRDLIGPDRFARAGSARKYCGSPFIVARSRLMVPRPGIGSAVKQQVELGIIGQPHPGRAATNLPLVTRPAADAEIYPLILGIEGSEIVLDQHVGIGAGVVRLPGERASAEVEAHGEPAHPEFAAAVADDHLVADDERRDRHRFADVDIADFVAPYFTPGYGIDRDHGGIEHGIDDQAVGMGGGLGVDRAAIDDVATRLALGE